ncbi:MAG TPA: hypothetical protein V6D00_08595 [Pantanalinema sp.]
MATTCSTCTGKGVVSCRKCFGTGKMDHPAGYGETMCDACDGDREVDCSRCEGTGEIEVSA